MVYGRARAGSASVGPDARTNGQWAGGGPYRGNGRWQQKSDFQLTAAGGAVARDETALRPCVLSNMTVAGGTVVKTQEPLFCRYETHVIKSPLLSTVLRTH